MYVYEKKDKMHVAQFLEEVHKMAKCEKGYSYLKIDYEGIYCP